MDDDLARAQLLAEWIGQNALLVFAVALAGALVIATLAFVAVNRWGGFFVRSRQPRRLLLGVWLVLGGCVLLAAAELFAETMDAMKTDQAISLFDVHLSETLSRELSDSAMRVFGAVSHLGDPMTLAPLVVAVAVALVVRRRAWVALGWTVACAGGAVLNRELKQIFERVRPVHDHGFALADGYSFPSGHTTGSIVIFGMLAYLCLRLLPVRWRLVSVLLATTLAFSIGSSRVVLRVHWASDVIAGFAVGLAWLTLCVAAMESAWIYYCTGHPST
jgi:membrane-associated phospholipid phosphatase